MNGRVALVTGVGGQDGSYMAEFLVAKNYRVVGTSRDPQAVRRRFGGPVWDKIEVAALDLRDSEAVDATIARVAPDEIYNFAAFSTGSGMYDQPVAMGDVNGLAVARILDAVQRSRPAARVCQASSSEMFGATSISPQNEATPFVPRSPYGAAKLFAHHLVGLARRAGLFACSAVLFNHESPRRTLDFVTRKVTRGAAAIRLGLADHLALGTLEARRDWGDARDFVRAMWLMLQAEQADDYVIATGRTHSVADLCRIAFGQVGLDWRSYTRTDPAFSRALDQTLLVGDARRARERLGWAPEVTFEAMIQNMIDADMQELRSTLYNKGRTA